MSKKIILGAILLSLFAGTLGAVAGVKVYLKLTEKEVSITKEYYDSENKVAVSPATLKKLIDQKDTGFVLVDLRSKKEYLTEHIIGAVNVPASSMTEEEIVNAFKKFPKDKRIIVHCYSAYCTLGKQVGQVLANNGIEVQDLNIGWSEWKYYWGLWNPGANPKDGLKYLEKGEAKTLENDETKNGEEIKTNSGVCTGGRFGC